MALTACAEESHCQGKPVASVTHPHNCVQPTAIQPTPDSDASDMHQHSYNRDSPLPTGQDAVHKPDSENVSNMGNGENRTRKGRAGESREGGLEREGVIHA